MFAQWHGWKCYLLWNRSAHAQSTWFRGFWIACTYCHKSTIFFLYVSILFLYYSKIWSFVIKNECLVLCNLLQNSVLVLQKQRLGTIKIARNSILSFAFLYNVFSLHAWTGNSYVWIDTIESPLVNFGISHSLWQYLIYILQCLCYCLSCYALTCFQEKCYLCRSMIHLNCFVNAVTH